MDSLETMTHGKIDAGYYQQFQTFIVFGNLSFSTKEFCEAVEKFAHDPSLEQHSLPAYNQDSFDFFFKLYMDRRSTALLTPVALESQREKNYETFISKMQNQDPEEFSKDATLLSDPVTLFTNGEIMMVDDYLVSAQNFAIFSYYVVQGGVYGWGDSPPVHAEQAGRAIQESNHLLFAPYKEIYKRLDASFDHIRNHANQLRKTDPKKY